MVPFIRGTCFFTLSSLQADRGPTVWTCYSLSFGGWVVVLCVVTMCVFHTMATGILCLSAKYSFASLKNVIRVLQKWVLLLCLRDVDVDYTQKCSNIIKRAICAH